jgi:mRNA interferase HigB
MKSPWTEGGGGCVRIITESRLTTFWEAHPPAEVPLKVWRRLIRAAQYQSPHEVKAHFPAADFLKAGVTVFDIGGNKYRLVVTMRYDLQRVYIRHVLTHAEYDRLIKTGDL